MKRYIISFLSIILVFALIASASSVSITIWGTNGNASGAQQNATKYGANNSVNVSAWNVTKTFMVKSLNASGDTIQFNISNMTAWRVYELKVNGTVINGYQAKENGMVNFTYSQNNSNVTYSLSPAVNSNGLNMTWMRTWNDQAVIRNGKQNTVCAVDTVYQNTNNTKIYVLISFRTSDNGETAWTNVSASNPPNNGNIATHWLNAASGILNTFFIVPPQNYYTFHRQSADTATVQQCTIWSET